MLESPSGEVTFCFTDIEGSSALSVRLGEALFGATIERHREILRDAWRPWGGLEVSTEGDGCFVVFAEVDAALAACVASAAASRCRGVAGGARSCADGRAHWSGSADRTG